MDFPHIKAVLLDLDGVMYRGMQLCNGAEAFVAFLRRRGVAPFFLSNNSRSGPEVVAQKLTSMGVPVDRAEVITAAEMLVAYMARRPHKGKAAVIGSEWLQNGLAQSGWQIVTKEADCLVVGLDHQLDYPKLRMGVELLLNGAEFIAANRDRVNPIENTLEPGCGAIVAALETSTGLRPRCIGKPNVAMLRLALDRLGIQPHEAVMVGDSLDSDMPMARRGHAHSVLVMSGQTDMKLVNRLLPQHRPELILADLAELQATWEKTVPLT